MVIFFSVYILSKHHHHHEYLMWEIFICTMSSIFTKTKISICPLNSFFYFLFIYFLLPYDPIKVKVTEIGIVKFTQIYSKAGLQTSHIQLDSSVQKENIKVSVKAGMHQSSPLNIYHI